MTDYHREAFETWALDNGWSADQLRLDVHGNYRDETTYHARIAWIAALDFARALLAGGNSNGK